MKGKIFSAEEATRMLPLVTRIVANARAGIRLLERHEKAVDDIDAAIAAASRREAELAPLRHEEGDKLKRLKDHMRTLEVELEDLGWFLVDPRDGVVKCYSERDSRIVYLTWSFGEATVQYWFPLKKTHLDRLPISDGEKVAQNQKAS